MGQNFLELHKELKINSVESAAVAGTTDLVSDAVDMQGYNGVMFILVNLAVQNAGNYLMAQQSNDDGLTDAYDDLAASKVVSTAGSNLLILNLHKPMKRYVRAIVKRGASTATERILAIRYNNRVWPQENVIPNVQNAVGLIEPVEGTP